MAAKDDVKALLFDVFGTVVDWRSSIIEDLGRFGAEKDLKADWATFADDWRTGYPAAMERVRTGELPWLKIDALHRLRLSEQPWPVTVGPVVAGWVEHPAHTVHPVWLPCTPRIWQRLAAVH